MSRVLVLFAHPSLEKSRVHRRLIRAVRDLPNVTLHDLYEEYPEFDVDVQAEQRLLSEHDVIVLEHPLYWYSAPALVKQWFDLVLEHGWAYGQQGTALKGKRFLCALSTGAQESAYQLDGFHGLELATLLSPIRQTAWLCKMTYWPPFVVHGAFGLTDHGLDQAASDYRRLLVALRDDAISDERALARARINADLDALLSETGSEESATQTTAAPHAR